MAGSTSCQLTGGFLHWEYGILYTITLSFEPELEFQESQINTSHPRSCYSCKKKEKKSEKGHRMPTAPACSLRKGEVNILQTSQRWLRLALRTPGEGLVVKFMMISELGSEFEPRALWSTTHPIPETLAGPRLGTRASLLSLRGGRWLHCKTKVGEEPSSRDMGQAVQGWGSQRNTP